MVISRLLISVSEFKEMIDIIEKNKSTVIVSFTDSSEKYLFEEGVQILYQT